MTRFRTTIDESTRRNGAHSTVTVDADAMVIDIDEERLASAAATAGAVSVAAAIRALPGEAWNRTGELANGIGTERNPDGSVSVVAPPDRLKRDPVLVQKLAALVPAMSGNDRRIDVAIAKSADGITKVKS